MEFSTYPFRAYIKLWQEQRLRPEHVNEPITQFYIYRVFTALFCIFLYIAFQVGIPMLIVLIDRTWPSLSWISLSFIMIFLITIGFVLGLYACKLLDYSVLKFELRNTFPTSRA